MKIKMLGQVSGLRDGKDWPGPGEELTVTDEEGLTLCANGMAVPVGKTAEKAVEERPSKLEAEYRDEVPVNPQADHQALTEENSPALVADKTATATPAKAPAKATTTAKKTTAASKK